MVRVTPISRPRPMPVSTNLPPGVQDVPAGQADHGRAPAADHGDAAALAEVLLAVDNDRSCRDHAVEHLTWPSRLLLADPHGREAQVPVDHPDPVRPARWGIFDGGIRCSTALRSAAASGSPRQFTHRTGRRAPGRSRSATRSSVTLSLTAGPGPPCPGGAARSNAARSARADHRQAARRAWSKRTLTHSDEGSITRSTACRRRPSSRARHRGW